MALTRQLPLGAGILQRSPSAGPQGTRRGSPLGTPETAPGDTAAAGAVLRGACSQQSGCWGPTEGRVTAACSLAARVGTSHPTQAPRYSSSTRSTDTARAAGDVTEDLGVPLPSLPEAKHQPRLQGCGVDREGEARPLLTHITKLKANLMHIGKYDANHVCVHVCSHDPRSKTGTHIKTLTGAGVIVEHVKLLPGTLALHTAPAHVPAAPC